MMQNMEFSSSQDNEENRKPLQPKPAPSERRIDRFRRTVNKFVSQESADERELAVAETYSSWKVSAHPVAPSTADDRLFTARSRRSHVDVDGAPLIEKYGFHEESPTQMKQGPGQGRAQLPRSLSDGIAPDESYPVFRAAQLEERTRGRQRASSKSNTIKGDQNMHRVRSSSYSNHKDDRPFRSASRSTPQKGSRIMPSSRSTPNKDGRLRSSSRSTPNTDGRLRSTSKSGSRKDDRGHVRKHNSPSHYRNKQSQFMHAPPCKDTLKSTPTKNSRSRSDNILSPPAEIFTATKASSNSQPPGGAEKMKPVRFLTPKVVPKKFPVSEKRNPLESRTLTSAGAKVKPPQASLPRKANTRLKPMMRSINEWVPCMDVPPNRIAPISVNVHLSSKRQYIPTETLEEVQANIPKVIEAMACTAKEQDTAATTIQSYVRVTTARYRYSLNRGALRIQKLWRGVRPRLFLASQRSAAITIAKYSRASIAREQYVSTISARKIQTAWRCHVPRSQYLQYMLTHTAATKIQTIWRAFKCFADYTVTLYDVLTVQKVCRAYIHSKIFNYYWEEREHGRLRERSALTIQRVARGWSEYKICASIRCALKTNESVITIQKFWRRRETEERFWFTLGSVIEIQCFARVVLARLRYSERTGSVLVSQSVLRRWLAKREYSRMVAADDRRRAATKIQTLCRAAAARSDYNHHLLRVFSATKIQTAWRCFTCHFDFIYTLTSAIIIQRIIRGHLDRKLFAAKWERREQRKAHFRLKEFSATSIQKIFRGTKGRVRSTKARRVKQINDAAIVIQSLWRSHSTQGIFWHKMGSIILLQSTMRMKISRDHFLDDIGCIIVSQCLARSWIARRQTKQMELITLLLDKAHRELREKSQAVLILQGWHRYVVKPKLKLRACIKLQAFFRMVKVMVDCEIIAELERRRRKKRFKTWSKSTDDEMLQKDAWEMLAVAESKVVNPSNDGPGGRPRERSIFKHSTFQKAPAPPHRRSSSHGSESLHLKQPKLRSISRNSSRKANQRALVPLPKHNLLPWNMLSPSYHVEESLQLVEYDRPTAVISMTRVHHDPNDSDAISEMSCYTAASSAGSISVFSGDKESALAIISTPNSQPLPPKPKKNQLAHDSWS